MVVAYNTIVHEVNSLGSEIKEDDKDCEFSPIPAWDENEIALHPFGAFFKSNLEHVHVCDLGGSENDLYKPEFFDMILNTWLPMAPFWTSLMLGML